VTIQKDHAGAVVDGLEWHEKYYYPWYVSQRPKKNWKGGWPAAESGDAANEVSQTTG